MQAMFATTGAVDRIHQGWKLRALAVTTATRLDALPDVPTVDEFVPGYDASFWARHRRAEEYASRNHRQAQQRDQHGPRRPEDKDGLTT